MFSVAGQQESKLTPYGKVAIMADDLNNLFIDREPSRRSWIPYTLAILAIAIAAASVFLIRHARLRKTDLAAEPATEATAEPASADPAPTPADAARQQALSEIEELVAAHELPTAREKLYALLTNGINPALASAVEAQLGKINLDLILSPAMMPEKQEYLVQPGDSFERIARKFKTTVDLLQKSNLRQGPMLHPNDRLFVFTGTFSMAVSKSRNDMVLSANGRFFKRYRVGTGKFGTTPTGTFVIKDKIEEPPWWRPDGKMVPFGDKENVLGTRWMSLEATGDTQPVRGYGLHGTWEPETIGNQASAGCIRLLNEDVEELFLLVPSGTGVVIAD